MVDSSGSRETTLVERDLCFIDIETTGPRFGYHEIIEVAAVRTDCNGRHILDSWQTRLRPTHPERITEFAARLTGFTEEAWSAAPFNTAGIWYRFASFAHGCIPVCHNPHFDRAFISLAASAVGVNDLGVDYHWLGTQSIAWPLFRRGRLPGISLTNICEGLGLEAEPPVHSAMGGTETCRRAYLALLEAHGVTS